MRAALTATALLLLFLLLSFTPSALASAPATVTVEVEGLSETKVPPTQVLTTTAPVVKDGNPADSCPGTSAAGALELATAGNWSGKWYGGAMKEGRFEGLGYGVEAIAGESYPFTSNYFWNFWLNNKVEEEHGVCGVEMKTGDHVLLFPCHFEKGVGCPTPLSIEAPVLANVGETVRVAVQQYNAKGEGSPAVGANVAGGGVSTMTDFQGHATLKFSGDGTYTLHVNGSSEGPPAVRTETNICVHEGSDGTCGTTAPSHPPSPQTMTSISPIIRPYTGPFAVVAQATGVLDGHFYRRGHAPRTLAGKVLAHTAVTSVSIRLRRRYRGRCYAYIATRERFSRARCGTGGFFKVANGGAGFSYLLPAQLPPGRFVFDLEATDAAGNHAPLDRGSSRIVFYVR